MGLFDSVQSAAQQLAGSPLSQTITQVSSAATNISDYLSSSPKVDLISMGVAAAGNLTPEQIASGLKGAPPQATIAPPQAPAAAISGANPGILASLAQGTGGTLGLVAVGALAYFIFFRKK